tara:strand:+ start:7035 stop:7550 length:516 start_codon:yes stop_codon:yes gene_type:complete
MDRVMQFTAVQNEAKELFKKKNQDYGDAFANYGPVGVLVRMGDKIGRLQSISKSGIQLVNDERLRDTLMDLHNYAAMAIMLMDEEESNVKLEENEELMEEGLAPKELFPEEKKEVPQEISWGIYGSTGNIYTRTQVRLGNKIIQERCTCPSYVYSTSNPKTCKHISAIDID